MVQGVRAAVAQGVQSRNVDEDGGARITVAGRVVSRREMGKKIVFLTLSSRQRGVPRKPAAAEESSAAPDAPQADERVEALVDLSR
jgi:lysyl-tRNA synthetase class II